MFLHAKVNNYKESIKIKETAEDIVKNLDTTFYQNFFHLAFLAPKTILYKSMDIK